MSQLVLQHHFDLLNDVRVKVERRDILLEWLHHNEIII